MTTTDNSRLTTDVIIIGAGIIGCSIAWHLAAGGNKVTVIDAIGVGSGMTAIQPGGIRTQWGSETTRQLAVESKIFYEGIQERLAVDIDPGFTPCGYAFVASTDSTAQALQNDVANQQSDGLTSRWLTADEMHQLVPGLGEDYVVGAAFNPEDGYFDRPGAPVAAFHKAAITAGAVFETGRVAAIHPLTNGVTVQLEDGRSVAADRCIVAAGIATATLVSHPDFPFPLHKDMKYLFYSDPIPTTLIQPLVIFPDLHFAVKQLADGSVLASDLTLGQATDRSGPEPVVEAIARREIKTRATQIVPLLEHVRYSVMVQGWYDATPDAQLVVGPVPQSERLWVAAGMNGRGMMLAPSIGRLIADGLRTGSTDVIPNDILPDRFSLPTKTRGESRVI